MVAVFGSFLLADVLELKQLGFPPAVGIALDATVIRLVLVPTVMALAGRWNWWLPEPLAARLPGCPRSPRNEPEITWEPATPESGAG